LPRAGCVRAHMRVPFWSFVIGLGALAGLPPLSGFWSKENVLTAAAHATDGGGPGPAWAGWVGWRAGGRCAGCPPVSGFWSKESVLTAAAHATDGGGPGPAWAGWVVWLAALL